MVLESRILHLAQGLAFEEIELLQQAMNILFVNVNWKLFEGMDSGAANRSTMFIRALAKLGHVDVVSFGSGELSSNIPNCDVVYTSDGSEIETANRSKMPKFLKNLTHGILNWIQLLCNPKSPSTYYKRYPQRVAIVNELYGKKKYDFVACRYIDVAWSCGLMSYIQKLIIDVDDNLRCATLRDLAHKKHNKLFSRWRMMLRARQIDKMSKHVLSRAHTSFFSCISESPYEESKFLHNVNATKYQIPDVTSSTPKRLLIVGWLDFGPNKYGALHFSERVFPLIKEKVPDVELHIVGKTADLALLNHLNSLQGVHALGFVEDLREEYRNSRVLIVPIYQGAGTSVKFVEGLMVNRPIVSTPMGARGFEHLCVPEEHFLLADNDEAFAKNVVRLLESEKLSCELARKANKIGEDNFSQERFFAIVRDAIQE